MIRGIGLRGAVAVNVITMIGIGPLITIPLVLSTLHGSTALVAWVVGAIIALCDGLAWAELGSLYPGSGGTYVFLRETFGRDRWGRLLAFLFAWQIVLSAPLVLASGYIGFAHYAGYLWPPLASDTRLQGFVAAGLAVVTLVVLYRPIRTVGAIGIALAGIAVATLAAVIAAAATHFSQTRATSNDPHTGFVAALAAGLGPALVITLYDYYGYGQSCTLGDEVRDTKRVLPRSVIVSIALVGVLYVALQIGVLGIVPWHELVPAIPGGSVPDAANYVASIVVERTLGTWPARIVTVAILVTAFASTFGNLLGYSRIPFSAARDGVFLKPFASLDARGHFPNVSLVAIGLLAIPACFLPLGDVINALTAGLVIIQSLAQLAAIVALRVRKIRAPYRMALFPLPLAVAGVGWIYIFISSGSSAIVFGIASLIAGVAIYTIRAARTREWPFGPATIALALFATALPIVMLASPAVAAATPEWGHAATEEIDGRPVFTVDRRPFFLYGAAFFYERLPRDRWASSMQSLQRLGINTLDLYVPWNWHELSDGDFDFNGRTSPRRDLDEVLRLARRYGFKIILRPGPVIRNEWRNGGYPAWLLSRPEYGMPEHDLLEGRYPPTSTLQNQHSDDAAAQWMNNATHVTYAKRWIERVLRECAPDADLILAIALDDDQGAYIDNQTYPAPHLTAYLDWLRAVVHGVTGSRVPVFINTYQMKVTASSPVWAMGNWYQSDAFLIGEHDRAQLEFSMGLLHTRPHQAMMASEFQAGWLEGPGDIRPRPADPTNTALALATMFSLGLRGVVNFPAQDTLYPGGWEAPFANGFYAWDAALRIDGAGAARAGPTAAFGMLVRAFGPELAASRPQIDAAVLYLGGSLRDGEMTNARFGEIAESTIAAQRTCRDDGISCVLVDPSAVDDRTLRAYPILLKPHLSDGDRALAPAFLRRVTALRRSDVPLFADTVDRATVFAAFHRRGHRLATTGIPGGTFATVTDGRVDGFLSVANYSSQAETIVAGTVLIRGRRIALPKFVVPAHDALVVPVNVRLHAVARRFGPDDRVNFVDCMPDRYDVTGRPSDAFALGFDVHYAQPNATPCTVTATVAGRTIRRDGFEDVNVTPSGVVAIHGDPPPPVVSPAPATPVLPLRSDADFGRTDGRTRTIFEDVSEPTAYATDVFEDGQSDAVLDNGIVRVVVSPEAGARAFVFQDDATGRNCFTTVGALRDDIAIEGPLSTVDKIAKYTHQFPAGTFDRVYSASLEKAVEHAAATFSYDAPDLASNGVTYARHVSMEPSARAFFVDETADFHGLPASDPQRAVSVSSLAVGDTSGTMGTQTVFAPDAMAFVAGTPIRIARGNALGLYDSATHEFATIAWRAGDVTHAAIAEQDHSIVVRLTLPRDRTSHVRYGYDVATTAIDAATLLAAADADAQRATAGEKGPTSPTRTP